MAADFVVSAGGSQLGNVEAGALGSLTSPVISAFTGGLVTVVGALVLGLALPAFTRYRREPDFSAREGMPDGLGPQEPDSAASAGPVPAEVG